jgi:hypothetical protein
MARASYQEKAVSRTEAASHRDASLVRTIAGGLLLSAGFLVEGAGAARFYSLAIIVSGVFVLLGAIIAFFLGRRERSLDTYQPALPKGLQVSLLLFAATWIGRMVLDYRDLGLSGYGLKLAAAYCTHVAILVVLILGRLFIRPSEALTGIVIGVAIYGLANLVADYFGIGPERSVELVERFNSRFDYTEERWLPPLAISNGSFSMLCAFSICCALRMLGFCSVKEFRSKMLFHLLALPILVICSVKVQFRGALIVVAAGFAWSALPFRMRPLLDMALLFLFPFVAMAFINLRGATVLQSLVPASVIEASGSSPEMFYTFSGRGYIWDYGFDQLADTHTLLMGEGPAKRDATPGLLAAGLEEVGMTIGFHHSLVELLVAHGLPLTLLVLLALWWVAIRSFRGVLSRRSTTPLSMEWLTISASIGAVAAGSLIDGPLGYFPILVLSLLPACCTVSKVSGLNRAKA